MGNKVLVIVESPTKAKTIKKFLPSNYIIEASVGHIRDLPQTAAEIPKAYKDKPWSRLGIDIENEFKPLYVTPKGKGKVIRELKSRLKEVDLVLLATDEDREGESISWHLKDVLKPKVPCQRMVFHEVTKKAILRALETGRDIDMDLVNAQETRRILDRLYGYTISPLLWKKIAYGLSAGRVQSPGLRLIVERERERILFSSSTYWDLKASLSADGAAKSESFEAKLDSVDGRRVTGSKDFNSRTGVFEKRQTLLLSEQDARDLASRLEGKTWTVDSVTEKENKTRPAPPFTTSTLQQESNRKLRMSARETMRTAQRLYEKGFITYMRTDSTILSQDGIQSARQAIEKLYGAEYLAQSPRQYAKKSKGAQEAHEAIRPSGEVFIPPSESRLEGRELSLYKLIWKRTLASQMAEARKASTKAVFSVEDTLFSATGTRIIFPGFIRAYVEGSDDPEVKLVSTETFLPALVEGQEVDPLEINPVGHETKPPARFTEASLVKELEKLGIGRPSTYASIINTLYERGYIRKQGTTLNPTFIGFGVIQLLEKNFTNLIEYSFTSAMEDTLDEIATGTVDRLKYLQQFYLGDEGLQEHVERQAKMIKPDEARTISMPQIHSVDGVHIGKYGPYILCKSDDATEEIHASLPEDIAPADLSDEDIIRLIEVQKEGPESFGTDPDTGKEIYLLNGRYGPYFQLGEKSDDEPKPKRASVPKGTDPSTMSVEEIAKILHLPRILGPHPDTGKEVIANNGRFGPYVGHDGEFRSLKAADDLYTVTLERALEILAEPKTGRGKATVLKDFGKDEKGVAVAIYSGRYGPYIKHGKKNIGLPKAYKSDDAYQKLTFEDVLKIIGDSTK
ncbi:MAG: type I DNA topoisomerase [Spirochaetia bacterium]|nr:type I DNA topoisomerase [Spirochaetia bacterium]